MAETNAEQQTEPKTQTELAIEAVDKAFEEAEESTAETTLKEPKEEKKTVKEPETKTEPKEKKPETSEPKKMETPEPDGEKNLKEPEQDPAETSIEEMPKAIPLAMKEKWEKADPEFRKELTRVMDVNEKYIKRIQGMNKELREAVGVADADILMDMQNHKISREQSIKNRLAYVSSFQRNPEETFIHAVQNNEVKLANPAMIIRFLSNQYKLDLPALAKIDPKEAQLVDENYLYRRRQSAEAEADKLSKMAAAAREHEEAGYALEDFMINHPELSGGISKELDKAMGDVIGVIKEQYPDLSNSETLEVAYSLIQQADEPSQDNNKKTPTANNAAAVEKAKKAAISPKPSSSEASPKLKQVDGKNLRARADFARDCVDAAFDSAM